MTSQTLMNNRPQFSLELLPNRRMLSLAVDASEIIEVSDGSEEVIAEETYEILELSTEDGLIECYVEGEEVPLEYEILTLAGEGEEVPLEYEILTLAGEGEELMYTCGFGELPVEEELIDPAIAYTCGFGELPAEEEVVVDSELVDPPFIRNCGTEVPEEYYEAEILTFGEGEEVIEYTGDPDEILYMTGAPEVEILVVDLLPAVDESAGGIVTPPPSDAAGSASSAGTNDLLKDEDDLLGAGESSLL